MATEPTTAGQKIAAEVGARLRARSTLLWIVSGEERRVEGALCEIAAANRFGVRFHDCIAGVVNMLGEAKDESGGDLPGVKMALPPIAVLRYIAEAKTRNVWILRDFPAFLGDPIARRALRSLAKSLQTPKVVDVDGAKVALAQAIVILSPSADVPPDLRDLAVVVRWPLPDRTEIGRILDTVLAGLPDDVRATAAQNGTREAAIEAAIGLSAEGVKATFNKSLVTQERKIVPSIVAEEKRRVVSECKGLEWHDPDPRGLAAVGGLDVLKTWLGVRRKAFSAKARDYGLPTPKGILCVGPPGTGKSLLCRAVSAAWGFPLIRFDLPAMKGGIVGQSEANIRSGLAIVEAVGNCVLWVDELDKAISPAGALDGGVSADQLGALLSWMQDRKGGAFVVATANDISRLPPELLRKGRFDEVFLVDLPTRAERREIVEVTLRKFGRDPAGFKVQGIADACEGFTGSEIASVVEAAMFAAFADGERAVATADLLTAARETVPQSRTASAQIKALREWAEGKARRASSPDAAQATEGERINVLDLT